MKKYILGAVIAFSIVALPVSTYAASNLTWPQVSSIIQLLQAFGADQSIITNVQVALWGSTNVPMPPPTDIGCANGALYSSTTGAACPTTPYISNVTSDLTGNAIIWGNKLGGSGNIATVSLNGNTRSYSVDQTRTELTLDSKISFKLSDFGVTSSGNYQVQVMNSSVGNSNVVWLNYTAPPTDTGCATGAAYSSTTGNLCTASASTLTIGKSSSFSDRIVAVGTVGAKIGSFTLTAGSLTGGVNVNTIVVSLTNPTAITNLQLTIGSSQTGNTIAVPSASNTFSAGSGILSLPASSSKTIDIYGDITSAATGVIQASVSAMGGITASYGSATTSSIPLQFITIGTTGTTFSCSRCSIINNYTYATFNSSSSNCSDLNAANTNMVYSCRPDICGIAQGSSATPGNQQWTDPSTGKVCNSANTQTQVCSNGASNYPTCTFSCARPSNLYNYTRTTFNSDSSNCDSTTAHRTNVTYTCDSSVGVVAGNQTYGTCSSTTASNTIIAQTCSNGAPNYPTCTFHCTRPSNTYNYTSTTFDSNVADCSNTASIRTNVVYTCDASVGIVSGNQAYRTTAGDNNYYVMCSNTTGIRGKVLKDDNGNGVVDSGEIYVRDASATACANASYSQSGMTITYGNQASGTTSINQCSTASGDPIFAQGGLVPGVYSVTASIPTGWQAIGTNMYYLNVVKDSEGVAVFYMRPTATSMKSGTNQTASALNALNSATQSSANFSYAWNNDLQIGSTGADVNALQTALTKEGIYTGDITGGFYNATYTAVEAFQQKYGIKASGYVGALTREKLNALYSK